MNIIRNQALNERINYFNLSLHENGLLQADSQWQYENICSPFNRLYFIEDGEARFFNAERSITLRSGHIYLIPAGTTYNYSCPAYMKKIYIHFNIFIPNGMDLFEGSVPFAELAAQEHELATIWQLVQSESLADSFLLKAMLYDVIVRLMKSTHGENLATYKYSDLLGRLFALIYQKVTARTKVKELALQLAVAPNTLSRRFLEETGMTISSYLDNLLIQRARQMLLTAPASIRQIAEELKFCDQYYFSRYFRKHQNETPSQYRSRMKQILL